MRAIAIKIASANEWFIFVSVGVVVGCTKPYLESLDHIHGLALLIHKGLIILAMILVIVVVLSLIHI